MSTAATHALQDADRVLVRTAAREAAVVAGRSAQATDRTADFPAAAIVELRERRLLAAALPAELGGLGCDLSTLVEIAGILARGCGSTAMIWAMHQLQIACVARHCRSAPLLRGMLIDVAGDQRLVASVTSEEGIGGNIRVSHAPVVDNGGVRSLDKRATAVSYGRQAGAFLVTLRRNAEAPSGDQVAVLIGRDQAQIEVTGAWNPMGMRGTDSPAMRLRATFDASQILPEPFADVAAATMVPLSHLLWSAVWIGLANEAFERARRLVRIRHRPGTPPDIRLARADQLLGGLESRLSDAVDSFTSWYAGGGPITTGQLVRLNALKVAASEDGVRVAERALEICGMAGYQEDGEHSVARILRDLYSARLMIANDRLLTTNATNLLAMRRS